MSIELFRQDRHVCVMFARLGDEGGDAVQSNQFLLVNGDTGAILDPGGNTAHSELYLGMSAFFKPHKLAAILASHADPDIIASLDRWMTATDAPVYISRVWERFAPHFCKPGKTDGRIVGIPDAGMHIKVGGCTITAPVSPSTMRNWLACTAPPSPPRSVNIRHWWRPLLKSSMGMAPDFRRDAPPAL